MVHQAWRQMRFVMPRILAGEDYETTLQGETVLGTNVVDHMEDHAMVQGLRRLEKERKLLF